MTEYRLLALDEYPAAVKVWVEVFGVEARFFESLLDGGDADDFSVGAFEGGRQVSSVHVFMRWFRDQAGVPRKVGGIGSVSTLQEARGKGHSFQLLQLAIAEMEKRGCEWSYLGTGVNDHYAKHGWRTLSTPVTGGRLKGDLAEEDVQPIEVDEQVLSAMATLHTANTSLQPMANARTAKIWAHAVPYRLTGTGQRVYMAYEGEAPAAYLVTGEGKGQTGLIEAVSNPGSEALLAGLVRGHLAQAQLRGATVAGSMLATDSVGTRALLDCSSKTWLAEERGWMGRPIAGRISWPELAAIHADPRGRRSEIDHF